MPNVTSGTQGKEGTKSIMATYLTGNTIRTLREKKGCTQRELAATVGVTDKAVSKWETGKGLPDITLIEPLAKALGVSVAELLSGACAVNGNRSANMLKTAFYVCPVCGNVIHATGEGSFSCCGITLPVQEPEDADQADEMHLVTVEQIDNDRYVRLPNHPMTKQHYVQLHRVRNHRHGEAAQALPRTGGRSTVPSGRFGHAVRVLQPARPSQGQNAISSPNAAAARPLMRFTASLETHA